MQLLRPVKRIVVFGGGGFAREVAAHIKAGGYEARLCTEEDAPGLTRDERFLVAIGDHRVRRAVFELASKYATPCTFVSPDTFLDPGSITIGDGCIVCKGCVFTTNVCVGARGIFNLNSTVGHDVAIGDDFLCAPGVNISGCCEIGDRVSVGTGASIRDGVRIVSDVTVGMGAVVTKNLLEPGIYVGNPVKRLRAT